MKYKIEVDGAVTRILCDDVRVADIEFSYATNQIVHSKQIHLVRELARFANLESSNWPTLPESTRKSTS